MLSPFVSANKVVDFNGDKNIISNKPIRDKCGLGGGDNEIQGRLEAISNGFRGNFIQDIA